MNATYDRVVAVLEDCLGVETETVTPDSHLLDDLGADSLDMLDLTFTLEREFNITLEREKLFPDWLFVNNSEFVNDGKLTEMGASRAKEEFPWLDNAEVGVEAKKLLIVRMLCNVVDAKYQPSQIKSHEQF